MKGMKIISILLLSVTSMYAQLVVRNSNQQPLMVVTEEGKVGIHTLSPTSALDVRADEVRLWDGSNPGNITFASGAGDLYVQDVLEVDNNAVISDYLLAQGGVRAGGSGGPGNAMLYVEPDQSDEFAIYAKDKKSYFTNPVLIGSNPTPPNSDYLLFLQKSGGNGPHLGLHNESENFRAALGVNAQKLRVYSQYNFTIFMDYDNNSPDSETYLSFGHNAANMGDPAYENLAQLDGDGNFWVLNELSAASIVDRTPYPADLQTAIDAVNSMQRLPEGEYRKDDKDHQLNHSLLHDFVRSKDNKRDLSATVSAQNEVIKHLLAVNKAYEKRFKEFERVLSRLSAE
ncbi:hypothetical protein GF406_22390 [candidate division KSB1 bacterium]|nr:hypothetical protein [candidate division KSB1 bacterium]